MDELRAALGLVQLARLERWNARRRELTSHYRERLAEELSDIAVPFEPQGTGRGSGKFLYNRFALVPCGSGCRSGR